MMIPENTDPVALTAQADIDRFYRKVIGPAVVEFAPGPDMIGGAATDEDESFARAAAYTHNALCWEVRRTFGLTIGALFERQLRSWLLSRAPERRREIGRARLHDLMPLVEEIGGFILDAEIVGDLRELWLVANAVRHGEGPSLSELAKAMPGLWEGSSVPEAGHVQSMDKMRLKACNLHRYTHAVMKFWRAAGASSVVGY
jgi:hypothetical protein